MFGLSKCQAVMAAVVAVGLAAGPALADTPTMTYTGYSTPYSKNVTITAPPVGPNNQSPVTVSAGPFVFSGVSFDGILQAGNVNGWCIDLANWFNSSNVTYKLNQAPPTVADQLEALLVGSSTLSFASNNLNGAAVQVAIWKTVYTNFAMNLGVSNGQAINDLADTFIGYATDTNNAAWKANSSILVALDDTTPPNQRLITLLPGPPGQVETPEPASLALISVGLFGLAAARRRRKIH